MFTIIKFIIKLSASVPQSKNHNYNYNHYQHHCIQNSNHILS
ncbi:hypothetical protein PP707_01400 [Acetobacter pasteurianus]|nr:hypothetical protein [Acetobacter pasteurianus]